MFLWLSMIDIVKKIENEETENEQWRKLEKKLGINLNDEKSQKRHNLFFT